MLCVADDWDTPATYGMRDVPVVLWLVLTVLAHSEIVSLLDELGMCILTRRD